MVQEMIAGVKPKMEAALTHFLDELKTLRTGRASAQVLDHIMVEYYGVPTSLKQLATITVPEATQIAIQPFDVSAIGAIRTAIEEADLGFNPSDDGRMLRIIIPPLTAERREELVKRVGKVAEAARVAVRSARGEVWEEVQNAQKAGEISEDNRDWGRAELDKLVGDFNKRIEQAVKDKEAEIRTV